MGIHVKEGLDVVMPGQVRTGQVMGLVEATGGLGSPIELARLADELGADIATLLPILDAGEILGLIKVEKGVVALTDFGSKFQKATKNKVRLVRDQLSKIEPFQTALEIGGREHLFTSVEVAEALSKRGIRWHHEPEVNEAVVHGLLVRWAIYAALLQYNGKTEKFQKVSTRSPSLHPEVYFK